MPLLLLILCQTIFADLPPPVQPLDPTEIETVNKLCGAHALPEPQATELLDYLHPKTDKPLFPWTVHLVLFTSHTHARGSNRFRGAKRCSGVLISNRHVLTAATCFVRQAQSVYSSINEGRASVYAGIYHWIDSIQPGHPRHKSKSRHHGTLYSNVDPEYIYEETARTIHPFFNRNKQRDPNDLAIVELDREIPLEQLDQQCAVPVCMPPDQQTLPDDQISSVNLTISGFGRFDHTVDESEKWLHYATVHRKTCKGGLQQQLLEELEQGRLFCVTEFAYLTDMGGPVTLKHIEERVHLLGIVGDLHGPPASNLRTNSEYNTMIVSIRHHMDWIHETIGLNYYRENVNEWVINLLPVYATKMSISF